jgi:hypothetical protein
MLVQTSEQEYGLLGLNRSRRKQVDQPILCAWIRNGL